MIKRIDKNILIKNSPDQVFSFISTLENLPSFTTISSIEKVSGSGDVGSIYSVLGNVKATQIEVTKKTTPLIFAWQDKGVLYENEIGYEILETDGMTKVTTYIQLNVSLITNLLTINFLTDNNLQLEMENTLSKLKTHLETTPPQTPASEPLNIEVRNPFNLNPEELAVKFKKSNY